MKKDCEENFTEQEDYGTVRGDMVNSQAVNELMKGNLKKFLKR